MKRPAPRTILVLISAMAVVAGIGGANAAAQDDEGFPLPSITAFCEPGHAGPLVGCTPWEGVTVYYETDDGQFSASCVTEAVPGDASARSAGCSMIVPFGSTIIASIDPSEVPSGYYLLNDPVQEWDIPDGPPTGLFGGPTFILYPDEDTGGEEQPSNGDVVEELPSTGAGSTADASGNRSLTMALLLISLIAMSGLRMVTRFQR